MKKRVIKLKKDEDSNELYLDLNDLGLDIDINKVKFYSIETDNQSIVIYLFDENKNKINFNIKDF